MTTFQEISDYMTCHDECSDVIISVDLIVVSVVILYTRFFVSHLGERERAHLVVCIKRLRLRFTVISRSLYTVTRFQCACVRYRQVLSR